MTEPLVTSAELAEHRADAEAMMLDAGRALRPVGGWEYVDGKEVEATEPLFGTVETPVPCKIQTRLGSRTEEAGGRTVTVVRLELHLPAAPPAGVTAEDYALTVGDLWEMTAPDPMSTVPRGRRYRILAPHEKTLTTARRYDVEVAVS